MRANAFISDSRGAERFFAARQLWQSTIRYDHESGNYLWYRVYPKYEDTNFWLIKAPFHFRWSSCKNWFRGYYPVESELDQHRPAGTPYHNY